MAVGRAGSVSAIPREPQVSMTVEDAPRDIAHPSQPRPASLRRDVGLAWRPRTDAGTHEANLSTRSRGLRWPETSVRGIRTAAGERVTGDEVHDVLVGALARSVDAI